MSSIVKAISMSLLLIACLGLTQSVGAQNREDAQHQANVDDEDDGLAFYDSNAGTYYTGIWQHLATPRNLEKDSPSQVLVNPALPLTDNHPKAN